MRSYGHRTVAVWSQIGSAALGGLGNEGNGRHEALRRHRVVAAMAVAPAHLALLLDVAHFAARCHFAIPAHDAAAGESGEAEKSNKTHDALDPFTASRAKSVPLSHTPSASD